MYLYGIYDVKDSERCIAVFKSRREVAEWLGYNMSSVYFAMKNDALVNKKYKIYKIDDRKE